MCFVYALMWRGEWMVGGEGKKSKWKFNTFMENKANSSGLTSNNKTIA